MDKLTVLSIPVTIGTYKEFILTTLSNALQKKGSYTCVANVHMLVEAYFDPEFAKTVRNAQMVTPDGLPLTWVIRLFYGIRQERVAGMDLLPDLLGQCQLKQIPVYFYGGHPGMIQKTADYLRHRFPQIKLAGIYSPPFRKLSGVEEEQINDDINNSGAQIVFVALGCPKQEKWMSAMENRIHAVMIGIGGALNVMTGEQKRAPRWIQSVGMEWFYRLAQEPGRLFKRYAVTNSIFLYLFIKSFIRYRLLHRTPSTASTV